MEDSGPRPGSSNAHYDRLISPKIGGDIAEDGAKDRRVAPTNLSVMSYSTAAVTGVCGEFGGAGIVLGRRSSQFQTQRGAIKFFLLLATFNQKDRKTERGRRRKKWAVIIQQNVRVEQ